MIFIFTSYIKFEIIKIDSIESSLQEFDIVYVTNFYVVRLLR
jgi:hypothetical protein